MSGVVRAHGQLVDGNILMDVRPRSAGGRSDDGTGVLLGSEGKELDGQHTGHAEFSSYLDTHLHGVLSKLRREVRSGREGLGADAIALHGLGDRPGFDLTGGAASHKNGQLASQINFLFRHERSIRDEKLLY